MEAKKIDHEQMQKLFTFTRQHFVEYYDLQAELADHLANAIEARWAEQPGLSFDEALHLEFKKFGIFGFSDIVEQRQNALFKKYYRLVWHEFRSTVSLPAIGGSSPRPSRCCSCWPRWQSMKRSFYGHGSTPY